jgi:hypothetical protein
MTTNALSNEAIGRQVREAIMTDEYLIPTLPITPSETAESLGANTPVATAESLGAEG